jgi:hypothetical protein
MDITVSHSVSYDLVKPDALLLARSGAYVVELGPTCIGARYGSIGADDAKLLQIPMLFFIRGLQLPMSNLSIQLFDDYAVIGGIVVRKLDGTSVTPEVVGVLRLHAELLDAPVFPSQNNATMLPAQAWLVSADEKLRLFGKTTSGNLFQMLLMTRSKQVEDVFALDITNMLSALNALVGMRFERVPIHLRVVQLSATSFELVATLEKDGSTIFFIRARLPQFHFSSDLQTILARLKAVEGAKLTIDSPRFKQLARIISFFDPGSVTVKIKGGNMSFSQNSLIVSNLTLGGLGLAGNIQDKKVSIERSRLEELLNVVEELDIVRESLRETLVGRARGALFLS